MSQHPNVPAEDRAKAKQLWFNTIQTGEPMDLSWRLLKRPVSPEAKRAKKQGVGGKPTVVKMVGVK